MQGHILIIEDDRELAAMLGEFLAAEGFAVSAVEDAASAITALAGHGADLVILDVMLPGRNGLDLLRELRVRHPRLPVMMLTARGEPVDRILGLELGADDYLPKPFDPRELAARARAVLRRTVAQSSSDTPAGSATGASDGASGVAPAAAEPDPELGPLVLDLRRRRATLRGAALELTGAEWRVLLALAQSADGPVERSALTQRALGRRLALYDRAIDTHVSNLRRKIARGGGGVEIRSVRGTGYELVESAAT
jgi:two-component system response regulator CpxR